VHTKFMSDSFLFGLVMSEICRVKASPVCKVRRERGDREATTSQRVSMWKYLECGIFPAQQQLPAASPQHVFIPCVCYNAPAASAGGQILFERFIASAVSSGVIDPMERKFEGTK